MKPIITVTGGVVDYTEDLIWIQFSDGREFPVGPIPRGKMGE